MVNLSASIHRVARGRHGAANLSREEAREVLAALLAPDADMLQLGAFLIGERMKGETPEELAGFTDAARSHIAGFGAFTAPDGAVDLPCYAGKRRAPPMHLAAALAMRDAGVPVVVHGLSGIVGRVSAWQALERAGVARATTLADAASRLQADGLVYLDVADFCPPLYSLLQLRPRLGVRSFAHTVARLLNPLQCDGQLNGVFHTPYAMAMARVNALLGQPRSLVFTGAEGEPELYADRQKALYAQTGDGIQACDYPAAGHPPYPRQSVADVSALQGGLLAGPANPREHAILERMKEAMRWAGGGAWPAGWRVTDEKEV